MEEKDCIYFAKSDNINVELKNNIDDNTIISVIDENGKETFYCPVENLALPEETVLTPPEIISETVETNCDYDEKIDQEQDSTDKSPSDEKPKLVVCGGNLLRVVPIQSEKPKQNFRVPPNTYRNLLTGNTIKGIRRKLIIDPSIKINPLIFKQQLLDTTDIVRTDDSAPKTKSAMKRVYYGCMNLLGYPIHNMTLTNDSFSPKLTELYTKNCITRKEESLESLEDMELLPVGYKVDIDRSKIKRITRTRHSNFNSKSMKVPKNSEQSKVIFMDAESSKKPVEHTPAKHPKLTQDDEDDTNEYQIELLPYTLEQDPLEINETTIETLELSTSEIPENNIIVDSEVQNRILHVIKDSDINASTFLSKYAQENQIMIIQIAN